MTSAVWTNAGELRVARELAAKYPLVTALVLSLLLHVTFYGFYKVGKQYGWWEYQATWLLHRAKQKAAALAQQVLQRQSQTREIPLEFVEVDPSDAVTEAPKEAKYYAAHSSRATNPEDTLETQTPKIDGRQDKVMRTEDVPKPKPFPLQPAAEAPAEPAPEPAEPKTAQIPGDLALRKPDTAATPARRERPRTLQEARAQKNLAGPKKLQEGGVRNRGRISVDAKGSPFGTYDAAFIAAVQQRWYDLLETTPFVQRSGKVVLEFRLNHDGRITDMQMSNNEVGDILAFVCQRAVLDPAPFGKWPDDMRRMVGNTYREVTFTFYYN